MKQITARHANGAPGNGSTSERHILIMEDEYDLRRCFSKALRRAGYDVHPAATIKEARTLLTEHRFDVFLCDIQMGNERGTDLLREESAALQSDGTQIIMVSAESHYRAVCEDLGAEFFMQKPVSIGPLIALVDRVTAS